MFMIVINFLCLKVIIVPQLQLGFSNIRHFKFAMEHLTQWEENKDKTRQMHIAYPLNSFRANKQLQQTPFLANSG